MPIQEFVSLLPHNPRVLDLGCGPENESMRLHYAGADVLGIDFSKECILFGLFNSRCTGTITRYIFSNKESTD